MSTPPHPNRLDEIVGGKYRVTRFLAAGGMGVVYEAQHAVVRRRFAVKFLHPDLAERRDILTRFQREAEAAGALESENIAAAVDFGIVADGTPYIVMEYLVGESLAALLERERRLPVGRAADLVVQASRGIQAAHASGIVHRDLKPRNLFVARRDDGTDLVKVLDFGVAKLQAVDEHDTATRTGAVLGTASYMAPEQARGDKVVDHRADIYALGAILYELVSGRRPHPGESPNAILYHASTQPAVPLDPADGELPAGFIEVVERALASDPNARPASTELFGQSLAPFARREVWPEAPVAPAVETPAPGRPTPAVARSSSASSSSASTPASPPASVSSAPSPLRRRGIALAMGAVALATGVALAMRAARQPSETAPTAAASTGVSSPPLVPPPSAAGPPAALAKGPMEPAAPIPAAARLAPRLPVHGALSEPADGLRTPRARPTRLHAPADAVPPAGAERAPAPAKPAVTFDQQNPYD